MITVTIIEDDATVLQRLIDVVSASSACQIVGIGRNRGESVSAILANRADIYLVDLGLPDVDGIDLIKLIDE